MQTANAKVSENGGPPPIPLEWMLRIYFLQLCFNLSDPAVEEALYDSLAMRSFVGIDLGPPDATPECKIRHLLERNKPGKIEKAKNRNKSRVGTKVEYVFAVIKIIFGKTRYHGLAKNLNRLEVAAALSSLYMVRRQLLRT